MNVDVYIQVYMCARIPIYVCKHMCMYTFVCVFMYLCTCMYLYIGVKIKRYRYTFIHNIYDLIFALPLAGFCVLE